MPRIETGCFYSAWELFRSHNGGRIFCVTSYLEDGFTVRSVHNYFIPPGANPDSYALNADDQDFRNCPKLMVSEVIASGVEVDPFEIKNR